MHARSLDPFVVHHLDLHRRPDPVQGQPLPGAGHPEDERGEPRVVRPDRSCHLLRGQRVVPLHAPGGVAQVGVVPVGEDDVVGTAEEEEGAAAQQPQGEEASSAVVALAQEAEAGGGQGGGEGIDDAEGQLSHCNFKTTKDLQ